MSNSRATVGMETPRLCTQAGKVHDFLTGSTCSRSSFSEGPEEGVWIGVGGLGGLPCFSASTLGIGKNNYSFS